MAAVAAMGSAGTDSVRGEASSRDCMDLRSWIRVGDWLGPKRSEVGSPRAVGGGGLSCSRYGD